VEKMKKLFVLLMVLGFFVGGSGLAQAAFSWQTEPIMGYDYSTVTGDVVMITGPTPTQSGGGYYYDVDGNVVLGPTIPHYSISGDPLEGVGSPSVTTFYYNPTVWDGTHWSDPTVYAYSGSGVNLNAGNTYSYTGVYDFLGTPGNLAYSVTAASATGFDGSVGFIMLNTGVGQFWLEDAGSWKYTETWTENETGLSITSVREFDVTPVPLPAAVWLLGTGLVGLFGIRRRFTS
jgi:hypothetical protein